MKPSDLLIYREQYAKTALADIWDKLTSILDDVGLPDAELTGLRVTEWIRTNWGGGTLVERHNGDARSVSRFNDLRVVLGEMGIVAAAADEMIRVIRADYLGEYIPSVKRLDQLERDYKIWSRGNTPADMERLARVNGISVVRVYQINKQMQESRDRHEQPGLFGRN